MIKTKKKNIKRIISLVCIAAIVIMLSTMPLLSRQKQESDGPTASILSAEVESGNVNTELIGGGTLSEEDAVNISVPSSVKLTGYLVSNGNSVSEEDPIATADRVTVMTAISEVQETLDYLSEKIEAESEVVTNSNVVALAGGIVKVLYAAEGESVQNIMLEHGALATLSLDGLMAVDFSTETTLNAGTSVNLTLSDDSTVIGKVESALAGNVTVTVDDNGYSVGEAVKITSEDGTYIGSGELYIHSPLNANAYAGTVNYVGVREGDKVNAGDTLMALTDVGYTATFRQLVNQRQAYEELMLKLFKMYQTETITAPCDGIVSGVDNNSIQLLSTVKQPYVITLLANSPNGDNETLYSNYVGKVTAVGQSGWTLSINPQNIEIADYMILPQTLFDTATMTELIVYGGAVTPVYELQNDTWVQIDAASISAGDILLFAGDSSGNFVWIVRIQKSANEPIDPNTPADPNTPSDPSTPADPSASADPNTPTDPNTSTYPSTPSIGGTWGGNGSYPQYGIAEQEYELYGLDVTEVASVTPQDTVTLDISINELDIASVSIGMTADVQIDALGGEKFTATVTDISNTGTNNGGYSYFTVELTMERSENMLVGMNATATMVTATAENVLTIPADALVEEGTKTVVYTGYDEKNDILVNPVAVTVGASDGQTVEIVEGLSAGTTFYYAYYDTLEISFAPDFSGGGFGRFNRFMFG